MAALVGTVGCGDDDGTPVDSGTPPTDTGVRDAGTPPPDSGPMDGGGMMMVDAGPSTDAGVGPMNCINATDPAALMGRYADGGAVSADGGMGSSFNTLAGACGLSCITATDIAACVTTCLRARTGNAVSMACAGCYGATVVCSATNCLASCSADPGSAACGACQCGMNPDMVNCVADNSFCTGIPSTACTPRDGGVATDAGPAATDAGPAVDAGPRDAGHD